MTETLEQDLRLCRHIMRLADEISRAKVLVESARKRGTTNGAGWKNRLEHLDGLLTELIEKTATLRSRTPEAATLLETHS